MLSSIKARVITFYLVVLFVTLSALGVFLYFSLSKIVYNSIDSSLLSRATALATLVNEDNNEIEFNFSDEIMSEYNSPKAKSFFQIRRFDGTVIEKSTSLRNLELPFGSGENRKNFKTILLKGVPTRLVNFYFFEDSDQGDKQKGPGTKREGQGLIVQCAEDMREEIILLKTYGLVLSISIFFVLIASASGGFFIARKALMPVKEISESVGRISESNLSQRITPGNIPMELRGLAASFNRTFDRLEESFKRQKQFTADASHELRTPLSVILSQSEITLRKERTVEEYKGALTAIEEAGELMSEIVTRLLTIARLSTDKIELRKESIDLSEIIRKAVKLLTPRAAQKSISINLCEVKQPLVIHGDRAAISELFANIVDNAINYNIFRGKIDISIKKENSFVVTEIRDTGIGIAEENLNEVFTRFCRVDKSRSKETAGIGLGLSICNEIVKLHGGRIEIRSQIGRGTTVSVYLKGVDRF